VVLDPNFDFMFGFHGVDPDRFLDA
jgi:hypothetical protein